MQPSSTEDYLYSSVCLWLLQVLFFGEMREASLGPGAEMPFNDTTPEAFSALLEYIYSSRISLTDISEEVSG